MGRFHALFTSLLVYTILWSTAKENYIWAQTTTVAKFRYSCLRQEVRKDVNLVCGNETLRALEEEFPKMLEFTASRGNATQNLRLSFRDLNAYVRENYGNLIENTGKNVFPLLLATDNEPDYEGVGGVWKLFLRNGTMKRIVPVSPVYEMSKTMGHMVVGIFSIVAPYFYNPHSTNWQPALRSFQQHLLHIRVVLQENKTADVQNTDLILQILNRSNDYITQLLKTNAVYHQEFLTFARSMSPLIERSMEAAAAAQAEGTIPALLELKEELGEEEWRKLYVIIPAVWPVAMYNIRLQVLEKLMSFEQIKEQVIVLEGASTEDAAKTTLGRIISDRSMAQFIWGLGASNNENGTTHLLSFSTRRDLLSTKAVGFLNEECKKQQEQEGKPACPFRMSLEEKGNTSNFPAAINKT